MAGLFCTRSLHTVRAHIPLIHFPKRFPLGNSTLTTEKPTTIASETSVSHNTNESNINNIGFIDDPHLPIKYRRTAISPEEILYIQRGGPD